MQETTLTDANGRVLVYKPMDVVEQLRMFKAIGSDEGREYKMIVQACFCIRSIDGVPNPRATNERQIEAMVGRVGDEGVAAVIGKMQSDIEATMEAADKANASGKSADPLDPSAER